MPYDPQPQAAPLRLLGLVQRTCQALQAMVASLDALDSVLLRLHRLGPPADPPTELMTGTCDTISRVVALLRREGPPLLLRAQALQPQGQAAAAMRMLHADLDALAAFQIEDARHWGFFVRRLRANTAALLAEFDDRRRRMAASGPQPAPARRNAQAAAF